MPHNNNPQNPICGMLFIEQRALQSIPSQDVALPPDYFLLFTRYFRIIVNNILNFVIAFNACGSLAGMMMASPVFRWNG